MRLLPTFPVLASRYLVTEAMECDLAAVLKSDSFELSEPHIQFVAYQIFRGLK